MLHYIWILRKKILYHTLVIESCKHNNMKYNTEYRSYKVQLDGVFDTVGLHMYNILTNDDKSKTIAEFRRLLELLPELAQLIKKDIELFAGNDELFAIKNLITIEIIKSNYKGVVDLLSQLEDGILNSDIYVLFAYDTMIKKMIALKKS